MRKIFVLALAAFALLATDAFAANKVVPGSGLSSLWDTGVLKGFAINGIAGTTNLIPAFGSNGGMTIGAGYAGTTPPTNGLIVQGNVGIGSTTPAKKLDVVGTFAASGASTFGSTVGITGDVAVNTNKFNVTASSGNTAVAGTLGVTGLATLTAGANSADNLTMTVAAKTLVLKQGANGKTGTVTCNSNTPVTVSNTSFTANSGVLFTLKTVGGTVGALPHLVTATPATGFDINCTASDTSVYNYHIFESAS